MKKLIITCALVSLGTMVSFAQSGTGRPANNRTTTAAATPEQRAETRANQFKKDLSLTTEQYTKVYEALLDYYTQDKMARDNGGTPGPGQSMQMQMGVDQRFQAALTPAQFSKYNSMPKNL